MGFSKTLSKSEAKYKYLGVTSSMRDEFPEKNEVFDVKFKGKIYGMKVSGETKDSIMLTQLYDAHEFQEGETLTVKTKKNIIEFSVEE